MEKWLYRMSVAPVALGLAVSIYMTIDKIFNVDAMCPGSGDCSTMNVSRYSEINGIPVAAIGVLGYLAILATHYFENFSRFFKQNSTLMIFGMALTGFLFTIWLIYVEAALLKAFCPFCVTSQATMTVIFMIAIIRLVKQTQS